MKYGSTIYRASMGGYIYSDSIAGSTIAPCYGGSTFLFEGEALNTLARSGFYRVAFLQSIYILYQI